MAKEFNLDDYKYVEEHMSYTQWLASYRPQRNHLNSDAKFDGALFEHSGEQWEHIRAIPVQSLWTLFRDEDGRLLIRNGLTVRGRLGYFLGEVGHNAHGTIIVDGVPEDASDLNF
jgi:hypothetical protein